MSMLLVLQVHKQSPSTGNIYIFIYASSLVGTPFYQIWQGHVCNTVVVIFPYRVTRKLGIELEGTSTLQHENTNAASVQSGCGRVAPGGNPPHRKDRGMAISQANEWLFAPEMSKYSSALRLTASKELNGL